MGGCLDTVAAGLHCAPPARVILGRILEMQDAGRVIALPGQGQIIPAE